MVDSSSVGVPPGEQRHVASCSTDNWPGIEAFAGSRVRAIPSVDALVAGRDSDLGVAVCAASAIQPFPSSFMTSPTSVDCAHSREAAGGLCENDDVSCVRGLRRKAAGRPADVLVPVYLSP